MPYHVEEEDGSAKPFKIIKTDTGATVGSSDSREKAERSIKYREQAEGEKTQ